MRWISLLLFSIIIFPFYLLTTHVFDNFSLNNPEHIEEPSSESISTTTERTLNAATHKPATTASSSGNIKTEYINKLNQLEESVWEEINQLEKQVESDLTSTNNAIKRGAVLLKYERKAREIEEKTDEQFTELMQELESNVQSDQTGQHLSQELKTEYEDRKSKLKSSIYEEVNAFLSES
ncbi:hypothetical protein [Alkalibacillus salilacus]|uniref:Molecular chaperone DnaK (HSP70) n=1 Tax=Alkalibacillus salilacus TaxID=284582 RepID=A0ABT9VFB9_9BACI|nr:hypothetical protein [Alkalibacillus salilacus]MDQ0159673.1 molecular chaperone DnaK (HSP70) [Alkalibacillus salilacus]